MPLMHAEDIKQHEVQSEVCVSESVTFPEEMDAGLPLTADVACCVL